MLETSGRGEGGRDGGVEACSTLTNNGPRRSFERTTICHLRRGDGRGNGWPGRMRGHFAGVVVALTKLGQFLGGRVEEGQGAHLRQAEHERGDIVLTGRGRRSKGRYTA